MMPSPPIDDRHDTRYSCWRAAGSAQARGEPPDWTAVMPSIPSRTVQSTRSTPRAQPRFQVKRAALPTRSNPLSQ
jgi:hypothetical protein